MFFDKFKRLYELYKKFQIEPDPCYKCEVYLSEGCCHIDGYLCDYPNCSILKKYLGGNNEVE